MSKSTQRSKSIPSPSKTSAVPNKTSTLNLPSQGKTSLKVSGRANASLRKKDLRNRKSEALRRLGISSEQMVGVPRITHMLEEAEGGLAQVIEALRASDEEEAIAFITKYDSVSESDHQRVTLEEISTSAGVRSIDLLGVATKALFAQGETVASIVSSSARPEVTKKTIQMALQDKGVRDREMFHTATGFLPIPKGTLIMNNRTQVANFNGGSRDPDDDAEIPEGPTSGDLPSMDDDVVNFQKTVQKMLNAAPVTIDA